MRVRGLLVLSAAAAVLLLPSGGLACDHYPEELGVSDLILIGSVEPQIGVPGFSGDLCCPVCDEVCIPGEEIPALEPESTNPYVYNEEKPSAPEPEPEAQHPPVSETRQQESVRPEEPVNPGEPAKPEEPVNPGKAVKSEKPSKSGTKDAQKQSEAKSEKDSVKVAPAVSAPSVPASKRSSAASSGSRGSGGGGGYVPEAAAEPVIPEGRVSALYPYRRIRLKPAKGIFAEAAGKLLWPSASSPFQSLFGDR